MASRSFLYFAFGSNLWSERIRANNKSAIMKTVALLKGYRLDFAYMSQRWKGASATIVNDPKSHVYGVVWEVDQADQESLDRQEGVADGIYQKLNLTVESVLDGSPIDCVAYQLREETRMSAIYQYKDQLKPSKVYKDVIIRGAKENKLPAEYISFLESIPDNGYDGEVNVNLNLKEKMMERAAVDE